MQRGGEAEGMAGKCLPTGDDGGAADSAVVADGHDHRSGGRELAALAHLAADPWAADVWAGGDLQALGMVMTWMHEPIGARLDDFSFATSQERQRELNSSHTGGELSGQKAEKKAVEGRGKPVKKAVEGQGKAVRERRTNARPAGRM